MFWKTFIVSCFLLCRTGTSFILRLPCKSESDFQVKVVGRRLTNHTIAQVTAKSVNECYQKCEDQDGCKSVNYRGISSENCQLNKKIKETAEGSDFEVSDGWEYHATSYNTTNIGSYCETFQPCPSTEYCMDTCSCPGYQCFECKDGHKYFEEFPCNANLHSGSCQTIYDRGHKISGAYPDTNGTHYCVMEDVGCGPGGWTLAMKVSGSLNTFNAKSSYWTNDEVYNALSPSLLPDEDAKYPAFNSQRFDSICIGLKNMNTGTTKWLPLFNVSASSLREIFARGDSIVTNVGRIKWMALMDDPNMQQHCNTDGLNMKSHSNKIVVRIGFMANNEDDCTTSDSFIGIGISRDFHGPVSAGYVGHSPVTGTSAMGYILIK